MAQVRSVGEFRKSLQELVELRQSLKVDATKEASIELLETNESIETVDVSFQSINTNPNEKQVFSKQKNSFGRLIPSKEANPLLDQQVTVFKPTSWIDCISLDSRRIFVHDKWIVARIALPVSRQGGLSELLQ